MIDDKDVKKIIEAMEEVFPTAKMMLDSFANIESRMATKEQFQNLDARLTRVEEKIDKLEGVPARVKKLEEALEIE